ncbi:MAG TPA: hypothetical protein VE988_11755, partial [Gemmataceae bacterium]|nr:hypothetical protein [Gemmataceae bacterium]
MAKAKTMQRSHPVRPKRKWFHLGFEVLEDRTLPSGFSVISTTPAADAVVNTVPVDYTVNFSAAIDAATVDAGDFRVTDNVSTPRAADSFAINSSTQVSFHYNAAPYPTVGQHTIIMAAGAVYDTAATALDAFSSSFTVSGLTLTAGLIPVTTRRDLVFDDTRNLLYITTSTGKVERYDVVNHTLMTPFNVGTSLNGADITPDGNFLYVAEDQIAASFGTIHKVNLANGDITDLTYSLTGNETGAFDIAIGASGLALFSSKATSSATVPLHQIDLSNDIITTRADKPSIESSTSIYRSADRSLLVFTGHTNSGNVFTFDGLLNTFLGQMNLNSSLLRPIAVNRNGTMIASDASGHVRIYDKTLNSVSSFLDLVGAPVFDPVKDYIYMAVQGDLKSANALTGTNGFTMSIGDRVNSASNLNTGLMAISPDDRWLFLSTDSGVRVFELPTTILEVIATPTNLPAGSTTSVWPPISVPRVMRVWPEESMPGVPPARPVRPSTYWRTPRESGTPTHC